MMQGDPVTELHPGFSDPKAAAMHGQRRTSIYLRRKSSGYGRFDRMGGHM